MTQYLLVLKKYEHCCQHWLGYDNYNEASFAMLAENYPDTCGRPANNPWIAGFGDWHVKWFCDYCYARCVAIYGSTRAHP